MSVAMTLHVKTMAHALTMLVPTRALVLMGGKTKTVQKVRTFFCQKIRFHEISLFCKIWHHLCNVLMPNFSFKISMNVTVIPLVSIMGPVQTTMVLTLAIAGKAGKVFTVRKVMEYYHFQFYIMMFEMFHRNVLQR